MLKSSLTPRRFNWSFKHGVRVLLSVGLILPFIAQSLGWMAFPGLSAIENMLYDARVRVSMPLTQDPRIVIVDIDDRSLAAEGQWPWSRDKLGELMDSLFDHYGIRVLGFDVVFAEPDRIGSRVSEVLTGLQERFPASQYPDLSAALAEQTAAAATDAQFARALEGRLAFLGMTFMEGASKSASVGELPPPLMGLSELSRPLRLPQATGYVGNLGILQAAAAGGGYFNNPAVDEDGVFRRVPLFQQYQGALYPSLSLVLARQYQGTVPVNFEFSSGSSPELRAVRLGEKRLPVDRFASVLVPFRGPQHSFPYISATDVLHRKANIDQLFDRIVLIGATAPGLLDHRVTPVANIYAGVEIHANLVSGMLDGRFWVESPNQLAYEIALLGFMGLTLALGLPYLSVFAGAGLVLVLILGSIVVNLLFWFGARTVMPLGMPILYALLCTLAQMSYGFFVEARGRRRLGQLFGQYIPSELVAELDASNASISLEGESREMTVLFSDIRNFTSVSERLSPKELTALMNEFLTPLTRAIHSNRGTIDKYMGDAIMAFWGAPLADPDHAKNALLAALDMVEVMRHLRADFAKRGLPELSIGIGINTGSMNVGNMGSEFRMSYTVLGDAVNLGSRLEGLCKEYGVNIVLGEETVSKISGMRFRELDRVRVKGKQQPVSIFEPLGDESALGARRRDELAQYEQALALYRSHQWSEASVMFERLSSAYPGNALYRSYAGRCAFFQTKPPTQEWDGVYTHTTK